MQVKWSADIVRIIEGNIAYIVKRRDVRRTPGVGEHGM